MHTTDSLHCHHRRSHPQGRLLYRDPKVLKREASSVWIRLTRSQFDSIGFYVLAPFGYIRTLFVPSCGKETHTQDTVLYSVDPRAGSPCTVAADSCEQVCDFSASTSTAAWSSNLAFYHCTSDFQLYRQYGSKYPQYLKHLEKQALILLDEIFSDWKSFPRWPNEEPLVLSKEEDGLIWTSF